jgi:hypothetical protein
MAKGAGADCIGFLAGIALAVGYAEATRAARDPKFRAYGRMPDEALLDDAIGTYLDRVESKDDARLADVLQMIPPRGVYRQHFGLVSAVADGKPTHIIHCTSAHPRKVTEHILGDWWGRVRRVYAWRGV